MKDNSLIYKNSLINEKDFIDIALQTNKEDTLPTFEIKETPQFYCVEINSFYGDKHILEISHKNNFLILEIKTKNIEKCSNQKRIFYLRNIDLNNILLHDFNHTLKLIIPKIV